MNCFESHGDFQLRFQNFLEIEATLADQEWVAFDDDAFKTAKTLRDIRVISRRDSLRIEETSAVVEFQLAGGWHPFQRVIDLCGDGAFGNWSGQSVLPKIAHHTAPRAFPIRQKDCCDRDDCT